MFIVLLLFYLGKGKGLCLLYAARLCLFFFIIILLMPDTASLPFEMFADKELARGINLNSANSESRIRAAEFRGISKPLGKLSLVCL